MAVGAAIDPTSALVRPSPDGVPEAIGSGVRSGSGRHMAPREASGPPRSEVARRVSESGVQRSDSAVQRRTGESMGGGMPRRTPQPAADRSQADRPATSSRDSGTSDGRAGRPVPAGAIRTATKDLPAVGYSGSASGRSSTGDTAGFRTPAPEDRIGDVLGSYRIRDILGKGGMGCVYRAEHVLLGRDVALKLLREDYGRRRDAVARFFQEARAVNRIRHRNIVDVTDLVELPDGTAFIIMELLDGYNLGKLTRGGAPIETLRALRMLEQLCDGLAAAHAVGIIHRDLKPDNIVVVEQPDGSDLIKILDFGVAKLLDVDADEDAGQLTIAGSVIGTPAYMSPEQAGGMAVDQRSDVYALGAIMYEIFARTPPFRGKSFGDYVRMHLSERPTPPSQTSGGAAIHPLIERIILRCLEKSPTARYQSAQELRDDLVLVQAELGRGGPMMPNAPTVISQSGPNRWPGVSGPVAAPPTPMPAEWAQPLEGEPPNDRGYDPSPTDLPTAAEGHRRAMSMSAPMAVGYAPGDTGRSYPPPGVHGAWARPDLAGGVASGTPSPAPHGQPTPLPYGYETQRPGLVAALTSTRRRRVAVVSTLCAFSALLIVFAARGPGRRPGGHGAVVVVPGAGAPAAAPAPAAATLPTAAPAVPALPSSASGPDKVVIDGQPAAANPPREATAPVPGDPELVEPEPAVTTRPERPKPGRRPPRDREPREPKVALKPFKVRFAARPSAELFANGNRLCTSDCTYSIDPEDGGSKTRRVFTLRRTGFKDQTIKIDMARPPKTVSPALEKLE